MLQTSGAISMSDVAVELGLTATANLTLDDSRVRKLAKRETAGSAIGLADLYGKANFDYTAYYGGVVTMFFPPGVIATNPVTEVGGAVYIQSVNLADKYNGAVGYDESGAILFSAKGLAVGASGTHNNFRVYSGTAEDRNRIVVGNLMNTQRTVFRICLFEEGTGREVEMFKHRNYVLSGVQRYGGTPDFVMPKYYSNVGFPPNYP